MARACCWQVQESRESSLCLSFLALALDCGWLKQTRQSTTFYPKPINLNFGPLQLVAFDR
mgnify:CR=1 FL=1